ncbi:hypothetical protein Q1695_012209 [Nippostrongylus brasiliensis]|nr:hypothetical protein Q1695_012209 [Nippostrongylus brasiliensis]
MGDLYENVGPSAGAPPPPPAELPPPPGYSSSSSGKEKRRFVAFPTRDKAAVNCKYVFYVTIVLYVIMVIWTFLLYLRSVEVANFVKLP